MSDVPFDPTRAAGAPGADDQPSEEEIRAYVAQLRAAPVDQVVAEVVQALLNAAQMKLGRQDGRLLIDLVAAIVSTGDERLRADLRQQIGQAVSQLRLAQVEAEQQVAAAAAQGHTEPGDLDTADAPPASGAASAPGGAGADGPSGPAGGPPPPSAPPSGGKKLWVPGR